MEIAFSTESLLRPSIRPLMASKASLSFFSITCPSNEFTSFDFAYNIPYTLIDISYKTPVMDITSETLALSLQIVFRINIYQHKALKRFNN